MTHIAYIHGLNSSHTSFKYIHEMLPEHKATFLDYESHQDLGTSIAQVLRKFPKSEPVVIVGHSLGGVIGTLIAAEYPDRVLKLVTMSSPFSGSRAASTLRWIPGSLKILNDITPASSYIKKVKSLKLDVPTISIISTGGHLPTSPEPNDSVVSLSSQRALKFGKKIEVNVSHFEVLMHDKTVKTIKDFVFGDTE